MPKTSVKPVDAEQIAQMADRGQDISAYFTNRFTVVRPGVQRVNVDFTAPMLKELDREAETLNISRQARHQYDAARSLEPALSGAAGTWSALNASVFRLDFYAKTR